MDVFKETIEELIDDKNTHTTIENTITEPCWSIHGTSCLTGIVSSCSLKQTVPAVV